MVALCPAIELLTTMCKQQSPLPTRYGTPNRAAHGIPVRNSPVGNNSPAAAAAASPYSGPAADECPSTSKCLSCPTAGRDSHASTTKSPAKATCSKYCPIAGYCNACCSCCWSWKPSSTSGSHSSHSSDCFIDIAATGSNRRCQDDACSAASGQKKPY